MVNCNETLDLVKQAQSKPNDALAKSFTQATGLVAYDLQAPALKLYPVITPLRNMIPRVAGNGGTATNWRAITGINIGNLSVGVSEGNRGGVMSTTATSYTMSYKGIGLEDNVSFEADFAATGFDDIKARAVEGLLRALMVGEEKLIIGGNTSVALGTTPTPTLTAVAGGGSLTNAAYTVACVALAFDGYMSGSVAGGIATSITRTNADSTVDTYGGGSSQVSATATVTPAANGTIQAVVATVKGAVAYAWYWGTGGTATLGAITTINSIAITATATGTQTAASLPAADNSANALVYDGLISQISKTGNNSYYATQANGTAGVGTPLTADGAGGIVEIDVALKSFWDNYRLSPDYILVSSQEMLNISKKVVGNGGAPLFRFNLDNGGVVINAGAVIGNYLNKFTMSGGALVQVMLHPNVPTGTIIFYSSSIPYPLSNVSNVLQVKTRRDYYQLEWPLRARRYEYGVYADEVLQNYFPPAFGMITNIANG